MDVATRNLVAGTARPARRLSRWINDAFKRLADLFASALALFFLAPVFLLIAVAVRRDSPGPVFFRSPRLGRGGRIFQILKFRTMYERPESYQGPRVTAQDDPRVTPVGAWLRQTKLNELPQFWNVLKGEMSLVGPRPEDPELARDWPAEIHHEVLSIRPGITSPASVLYRDEEALLKGQPLMETYFSSVLPSKLRLDQLYVRNRSFWLDLDILFWTAAMFFPLLGLHKPPEDALFAGFFSRLFRRLVSWYAVDLLITLLALSLTGLVWRSFGPFNVGWLKSIALAVLFAFLFTLSGTLFGVHRVSWSKAALGELFNLLAAALLALGLTLLANRYLGELRRVPGLLFPPAMLVASAALSLFGFVLVRYRSRLLEELVRRRTASPSGARRAQERVLIIGGGEAGQFAAWLLTTGRSAGLFNLAGFVDDDLFKQGLRISGLRVLGRREDIPRLVHEHDIGILVFAIHNIAPQERQQLLEICAHTPARLVLLPDVLGDLHGASGFSADQAPAPDHDLAALLAELDALAQAGDLPALQERLSRLRSRT